MHPQNSVVCMSFFQTMDSFLVLVKLSVRGERPVRNSVFCCLRNSFLVVINDFHDSCLHQLCIQIKVLASILRQG